VASLQAEVLKELKAKQALEETVKAMKANVTSPPAATPAPAAAAGAGSSGRAAAGCATGGRSAKRRRGEALPEDEEFHGEGVGLESYRRLGACVGLGGGVCNLCVL
jgi:hypothetical protein